MAIPSGGTRRHGGKILVSNEALSQDLLPLSGLPPWSSRVGLRAGIGADRNRSDDTLSPEISCLNASCTIEK